MGHGRALLSLNSAKEIDALRKKIIRQTLSVRETEAQISRWKQQQGNSSKNTKVQKGIFVKKLEMELERKLGTKVEITPSKKGGKVLIRYYSDDDLERIRTLFI
jgi:ParB family chromosome partitioning protein